MDTLTPTSPYLSSLEIPLLLELPPIPLLDLRDVELNGSVIDPSRIKTVDLSFGHSHAGSIIVLENQFGQFKLYMPFLRDNGGHRHQFDFLEITFPDFKASSIPHVVVDPNRVNFPDFERIYRVTLPALIVANFCLLEVGWKREDSRAWVFFNLTYEGKTYTRKLDYTSEENPYEMIKWRFDLRQH